MAPAMEAFGKILVPTDFSDTGRKGVERGADFARRYGAKVLLMFVVEKTFFAPVGMVHAVPVSFSGEGDLLGEAVEDGDKRLKALQGELFDGVDCTTKVSVAASGAAGILDVAGSWRPDLIVMSSHGRSGVLHLLLGSTTERVVRHAACEVLVVK
jgi:nucleotide-binding universal stress UspA family protein